MNLYIKNSIINIITYINDDEDDDDNALQQSYKKDESRDYASPTPGGPRIPL